MSNINYSDLKRIRQDELKTKADLIYSKMNNVAAYVLFQTAVTDLMPIADAYQQALILASNGGTDRVNAKNDAKALLLNQLTKIGKFMDAEWQTANYDVLKEEAGYVLAKAPEKKDVKFVDAPKNFTILNTDRKGDVKIEWENVANARTYAFEELQSDGSWKNGRYATTSPVVLSNLPLGLKLTMRMKTVGPENIISDYTEPATVWVS